MVFVGRSQGPALKTACKPSTPAPSRFFSAFSSAAVIASSTFAPSPNPRIGAWPGISSAHEKQIGSTKGSAQVGGFGAAAPARGPGRGDCLREVGFSSANLPLRDAVLARRQAADAPRREVPEARSGDREHRRVRRRRTTTVRRYRRRDRPREPARQSVLTAGLSSASSLPSSFAMRASLAR